MSIRSVWHPINGVDDDDDDRSDVSNMLAFLRTVDTELCRRLNGADTTNNDQHHHHYQITSGGDEWVLIN